MSNICIVNTLSIKDIQTKCDYIKYIRPGCCLVGIGFDIIIIECDVKVKDKNIKKWIDDLLVLRLVKGGQIIYLALSK